ncbi:MAG: YHS domain-containing protein [Gallionella sp.]|nr:YHS domain-containing protein [Gallionella sp.]
MGAAIDPVCGMEIGSESGYNSGHNLEYAGKRYYFCSRHCLTKFQANPDEYLKPVGAASVQSTGVYTCPMHPEVRQATSGSCPKCGMALERESPVSTATGIAKAAGIARPLQFGFGAFVFLLVIYFGVVSLISGVGFAFEQFTTFWYFIVLLALGFGIQIGLYTYLKNLAGQHGASGKMVAVSGTTSTAAMVSCCAHYLVNILPVLGVTGILTVVAEYQIELFWVGLAFNVAGILYVGSKVIQAAREHKKCVNNS